eukprot:scaffold16454_cov117-Isochrysis_galbana.AAC.8
MNRTIVITSSGLHDVALPLWVDRAAPLSVYSSHTHSLRRLVDRSRAVNPSIEFMWRATSHSPFPDWRDCMVDGYANTHAGVVDRLNQIARTQANRSPPIPFWEEPAMMSYSAPHACFRDPVHHDLCGAGAEHMLRHNKAGRCALMRMGRYPPPLVPPVAQGWAREGGLSEAITQSLFWLPLFGGCACAGGGVGKKGKTGTHSP